jgi:hypothetical protein
VAAELGELDWVRDARVRLREEGHVFTGEAFVVPRDDRHLTERLAEATDHLLSLDWRLHEIVLSPVPFLDEPDGNERVDDHA